MCISTFSIVLTDKRSCCEWLGVRFIMETLTTRVTTSAQNIRRRRPGGIVAGGNRGGEQTYVAALTGLHVTSDRGTDPGRKADVNGGA